MPRLSDYIFDGRGYIDASLNYIKATYIPDVSLNDSYFVWNAGLLDVSVGGGGVTQSYVDGSLALKADLTYVDASLNVKADLTYVDASLNVKADLTYVDSSLASRDSLISTNTSNIAQLDASIIRIDASLITILSSLSDVSITSISDGDFLEYDSSWGMWFNVSSSDASIYFYTKDEIDSSFALYESKVNLDSSFNSVYTEINLKADLTYVDASLIARDSLILANTAEIEQLDASIIRIDVDITNLRTYDFAQDGSIDLKADLTYVDASLNAKQDTIEAGTYLTEASLGMYPTYAFIWENGYLDVSVTGGSGVSQAYVDAADDLIKATYIPDVSLNDSYFVWNNNLLEVSAGGTGDVTKAYVDASLLTRDAEIAQLDASIIDIKATYIPDVSLNDTYFVWNAGLLDVSAAGGSSTLQSLTDVSIISVSNNDYLTYDSSWGLWVNVTPVDSSDYYYTKEESVALFVTEASLGSGLFWVNGSLDVSVEGGVTQAYVDGSLAIRDVSINDILVKIEGIDSSLSNVDTSLNEIWINFGYVDTSLNDIWINFSNYETKINLDSSFNDVWVKFSSVDVSLNNIWIDQLSQDTDITNLQTKDTNIDTSLNELWIDQLSQDTDITNLQTKDTNIDTSLNNIWVKFGNVDTSITDLRIYTDGSLNNKLDKDGSLLWTQVYSDSNWTLEEFNQSLVGAARIYGGQISENADGTVDVSAGIGIIKVVDGSIEGTVPPPASYDDAHVATNQLISWEASINCVLSDEAYNYIYYEGDTGTIKATTDFYSISFYRDFTLGRAYRRGTNTVVRLCGTNIWNFNRRVQLFGEEVFPVVRGTGLVTGDAGTRHISVSAGVVWAELVNRFTTPAFDSTGADTFSTWHRDGGGGWTETTGISQVNNTNYDDGDGTLGTLTPNRYGVHWVYVVHDGTVHLVYGRGDYTLTQAEATTPPSDIPGLLSSYATLSARIIIAQNATELYEINSAFTEVFQTSGVVPHNDLSGLQGGTGSEYYHLTSTQYTNLVGKPYIDGSIATLRSYTDGSLNNIRANYIPEASLNDTYFTWNTGLLEPSILSGVSADPNPTLGADLDTSTYYVQLNYPEVTQTGSGTVVIGTVNSNSIGIGGLMKPRTTDGQWINADADSSANMPAVAIALEAGTGARKLLLEGIMRDDTWSWTPGKPLYASSTVGLMQQTPITTSGSYAQAVGVALTANTIRFKPDYTMVKLQ